MTTESSPSTGLSWLASTLTLGLLVTALSVFTALTNYATYKVSGEASDLQTQGDRLLADSNTLQIQASQFIIVDYTMYDNFKINSGVDDFAAEYYQSLFSEPLQASVDREAPFDDQYYTEMYADADEKLNDAFDKFDQANALGEREAGFQLAMLMAAIGLAFSAYASLLDEANRLRRIFSLSAMMMLVLSIGQFVLATR